MPSSRAIWTPGRWRSVVLFCVFAIAGLAAVAIGGWLASSRYGTHVVEICVSVPILIAIVKRPLINVMLLLAVVASVFSYGSLPRIGLPGNPPINVADVLLVASIGGTVLRRPWRSWPPVVKRYFYALLLVLLLAGVATFKTAVLGPEEARNALYAYRNLLYLAVALTIALEFSGDRWRALLNANIFYAAVVSALSIAAVGSTGVEHFLSGLSAHSITTSVEGASPGSATRVRLPGLYFVYSMCIITLVSVLLLKDRWRFLRGIALVLIVAAIAASLNRNMYAGAVIGLGITALLGGTQLRYMVGLGTLAVLCVTLVVVASLGPAVDSGVGSRASTLLAPSHLIESGSLQDRAYEYSKALPAISAHPWFGVGPRQFYGAYLLQGEQRTVRFFVQNLYVDFATDYGIPTALAFLLLPLICLLFGATRLRYATNPFDRAIIAAAMGTLVAMLVSCLVGTFVQDPESTVAFGAACGFLLAAGIRVHPDRTGSEPRDPSSTAGIGSRQAMAIDDPGR